MFRRITAISLLFSFIAMSTSGAMMFVIEKPSFTMQMHPVHKLFGVLMVLAVIAHATLNFRSIRAHLRARSGLIVASVLTAALVMLYGVAINNRVPADLADVMDDAAARAEAR